MLRRKTKFRIPGLHPNYFFAGILVLLLAGCSSESTDPVERILPDLQPTINGKLSREHVSGDAGGSFSDQLLFWVDQEVMGDIAALRLADQVDDTPEPGDPDGFEFLISPVPDLPLFTAGQNITVEFLAEGGNVRAIAFFEGPDADLMILSPIQDGQVSLEGFEVHWRSDGIGTVVIKLASVAGAAAWETMTENDGVFLVNSTILGDFPKGPLSMEVAKESAVLLSSVELGGGAMTLLMSSTVVVGLGS